MLLFTSRSASELESTTTSFTSPIISPAAAGSATTAASRQQLGLLPGCHLLLVRELAQMHSASSGNFLQKINHALRLDELSPGVRKIIIGIVGGLVLVAGIAMVVLPGPAFVVIPLGLAILASEFAWARHYLNKARDWIKKVRRKKKNSNA